ncbi:carbon-nitrogen hydrolase family protein [Candidatus Aenigmatarchaeota archaeon]
MKNNVRVAAAQIKLTHSINKNIDKISKFVEKAAKKKCDIVCFPEESTFQKEDKINDKVMIEINNGINKIREKCREHKIWIILPTYEKVGKKIYNTALVINRKGTVVGKIKKKHLWRYEKKSVSPGSSKVIKTEFGKIAVIICWDFAFPTYIQSLSKKGARIIFCPSFLVAHVGTEKLMESVPIVRAFENIAYYVTCDAITSRTASRSFIASPYSILRKIEKKEGMIYADLDLKRIDKMRKSFDTLC